jgi:exosortase
VTASGGQRVRPSPAVRWTFWSVLIVGATLAIFWRDLLTLFGEGLVAEGYSYVLLLPFVVAYLIYKKRTILDAMQSTPETRGLGDAWTLVGASLILTSFVVYYYSSFTFYAWEWRLLMLPAFVSGAVLVIFGFRFWRVIAIPLAMLLFFEPIFVLVTNPYWEVIANVSAIGSHAILNLMGVANQLTTSFTGPVIETANTAFDIGVGSSGLQSLVGYTLFAVFAVYILYGSIFRRLALFVLGYPLLVALNIVRIVVIVALTVFVGPGVAGAFHLTGGLFLVFLGTLLLLVIGGRFFRLSFGPMGNPVRPCEHQIGSGGYCTLCGRVFRSRGPSLTKSRSTGILVLVAGTLLLLSVLTPAFAQTTAFSKVSLSSNTPSELIQLLPAVPGWNLTFDYRDTATQAALQQVATLVYTYQKNSSNALFPQTVYAFVQIGPLYHTWQGSLVTKLKELGLQSATVIEFKGVKVGTRTAVPGDFFVFQRAGSNLTEAVLEWITQSPFLIDGSYENEFVMMSIYQNVPALVNTGLVTNSSDLQQVLNLYSQFGNKIADLWAAKNTVAAVNRSIPVGYALVASVAIPDGLAIAGYSVSNANRRRTVKRIVQTVASKENMLLLEAVKASNVLGNGLLTEIRDSYTSLGGTLASIQELPAMLREATELGILELSVLESDEKPYLAWRLKGTYEPDRGTTP